MLQWHTMNFYSRWWHICALPLLTFKRISMFHNHLLLLKLPVYVFTCLFKMQSVKNYLQGKALGVAELLTPVLKVTLIILFLELFKPIVDHLSLVYIMRSLGPNKIVLCYTTRFTGWGYLSLRLKSKTLVLDVSLNWALKFGLRPKHG